MIGSAEGLIAFWDDISRGAANAIQEATKKALPFLKNYTSNKHDLYEIFRQKVEYIRISILDEQNYPEQADHWDLKYADEKCCKDEHIQKLLFNCTTVHNVSSDFSYSNMLAS